MDLFSLQGDRILKRQAPLAYRMRPRTLDEFFGQEHILAEGKLLRRAILGDRLTSVIFYGPPGTGKTALANIIAGITKSHFQALNAVTSGIADIRRVMEDAGDRLKMHGMRTILFIDEVHRFNKTQQDALLPAVEDGTVIFIGATTENPFFEITRPLLSRSRVFKFEPLDDGHISSILRRALEDKERGLGEYNVAFDEGAFSHLVKTANGDARAALNALELAVITTRPDESGIRRITLEIAEESIQQRVLGYDKSGDNHYDVASAFIKSMRGSDPDATAYWLARMIAAGEKPEFIARRILIQAAEDVGLADPQALLVAQAAAWAVNFVGWPEAGLILAEAALYVATAPKSNSCYIALKKAKSDVETERTGEVPPHLRDASYKGASSLGHGKGYKYPHDYPGHYIIQQYLPHTLAGKTYYQPSDSGYEGMIRERLHQWKKGGSHRHEK